MSLLSNTDIQRMRGIGAVVIDPFVPAHLNNTSIDLTLGDHFARYRDKRTFFDLAREDPAEMFTLEEAGEKAGFQGRGIYLDAGERVLGHSNEIAGGTVVPCPTCGGTGQAIVGAGQVPCLDCMLSGKIAVTSQLHATSTAGRIGLTVCQCAGFGDVGYLDRWTLEIQNHGELGLWLPVGAVLCQVSFYRVAPPIEGTEYTKTGRYAQQYRDPADIHRHWSPDRMLPKRVKVRPSTL